MKTVALASLMALMSLQAFAQTPEPTSTQPPPQDRADAHDARLATPTGHEVNLGFAKYTYNEPGDTSISIHGPKVAGDYAGTFALSRARHWFARAEAGGRVGNARYDGWCFPFQITPNKSSPNGWELGLGEPSPCSETGDRDWYVETRGLVGKDVIGEKWGWSPYAGLGFRHLSNGTTGVAGFRTDNYLYVPLGITARTTVGSRSALGLDLEYDRLIRGWQTTRDSALGSGDVPATRTAPAFTIDGFTDISFSQHSGWALRASAKYQLTRRWSVQPSYIYWNVSDSPVSYETVTFTVNNIAAREDWGAYEPRNNTHEFDVKLGVRF